MILGIVKIELFSLHPMSDAQNKTLNDILETVTFIKENAATNGELTGLEERMTKKFTGLEQRMEGRFMHLEEQMTTKEDLTTAKTEIMTHVDDFITLHRKLETELVALQSKYTRLESQIQLLAKHLHFALPE